MKHIPVKTRTILAVGILLAFAVALPLFIWAIITQRFELRKFASTETPTPTSTSIVINDICLDQPNGTSCSICPSCYYSTPKCLQPCRIGVCQNNTCALPSPSPTPSPVSSCLGQPNGTSCEGGGCPSPWPTNFACTRPIFIGLCQNEECLSSTPTPSPTPTPSCPNGDKGNLNCDPAGLINTTDLSILLANWHSDQLCPGITPSPTPGLSLPDLNGDCKVNTTDLSILLSNWKPI